MSNDKTLQQLLNRVSQLESLVATIQQNTNAALSGHAKILESLVNHTKYVPAPGKKLVFPRMPIDVGNSV